VSERLVRTKAAIAENKYQKLDLKGKQPYENKTIVFSQHEKENECDL